MARNVRAAGHSCHSPKKKKNMKINRFILPILLLVVLVTIVYCAIIPHNEDMKDNEIEPSDSDGVNEPLPDTRPVPPLQHVPTGGQKAQAATGDPQIGIGNLVSLKRFGPWQDLGLDVLGGLIQVSVNRAPGNRNVAVRIGNHEINVG